MTNSEATSMRISFIQQEKLTKLRLKLALHMDGKRTYSNAKVLDTLLAIADSMTIAQVAMGQVPQPEPPQELPWQLKEAINTIAHLANSNEQTIINTLLDYALSEIGDYEAAAQLVKEQPE